MIKIVKLENDYHKFYLSYVFTMQVVLVVILGMTRMYCIPSVPCRFWPFLTSLMF